MKISQVEHTWTEEWLDLYIAIQKGPRIRKITFEKSVGYEVIEE